MIRRQTFYNQKLAELHVHVGGAIDPAIMWDIAHEQGIKLPTKDFWEFVKMLTIEEKRIKWKDFHQLFEWTEIIQSSPYAMERCVHEIIGGAYRSCNITLIEVSFNPMFRNRRGERDLDHIILASLQGMDKALLQYPQVKAGLIFFLDRRLSLEKNEIILQKAIKYKNKGVVGIDLAGPSPEKGFSFKDYEASYQKAREAGLGTSVHAGEEGGPEEVEEVIEYLKPQRIVHGIKAYKDKKVVDKLREKEIVLAICPTSNLKIGVVENIEELREVMATFQKTGVKFSINTDDPEFFKTNLIKEFELLLKNKILSKGEILEANKVAFESSFIR